MITSASESPPGPVSIHYTEYGIPIRNLWHMCLYAWREVPLNRHWAWAAPENAPTLDALLASILAGILQQRLRIGLGRSYVNDLQSIRGIRGQIDFTESLKQHSFERGQAYCEFPQYSENAPKNQIIRSTLLRLIHTGNFGPNHTLSHELRHQLRILTRALGSVDLIELNLDFIRRQQLTGNDGDYRLMLAICELVLLRQMPSGQSGLHRLPSIDHDALVLHTIYERFIANFYRTHLPKWKVTAQKQLEWHAKSQNRFMPLLRPDLVMEDNQTGQMIVLDTKFTAQSLVENQWGKQTFDSSHLYQLYAYLRTQEHVSAKHKSAMGILLYPAIHQNKLSERIEIEDHIIRVESVDLSSPWQEIEQSLLDLILKK